MLFTVHASTMLTGVLTESHLDRLVPCVLSLTLLMHLCLAAPGLPGTQREDSLDAHPPSVALSNPFGTGEEERRLLQSYIQSNLKKNQGGPEISSWEQEVFFLFRLYDYDRSGFLDGLEMMKLLSDYNSHHAPEAVANELVVSMVDFLLQTQDLNQDGLLNPSELLSPALTHTQQEMAVDKTLSNTITEEETPGAVEHREEEAREEIQLKDENEFQQVKTGEDEAIQHIDEHNAQQFPETPEEEQEPVHKVPVHQGQPEI
ncbi:cell growth regulator with EF hand domain protein 1 isoform X2 [Leuresthes tenuis]|uniref:cell growth regulator with EF hand domain protein 1 isoform X2 n=1 Tax=Leuresthes tenuis TaxID=355514 RepID=UPI003B50226A